MINEKTQRFMAERRLRLFRALYPCSLFCNVCFVVIGIAIDELIQRVDAGT